MSKKILVAYASRAGSTAEVAEEVGRVLRELGADVDVQPCKAVKNVASYDAVVIGTAVRMGKLLPEAVKFTNQYCDALEKVPTAYFTLGLAMKEDTPENRETAYGYLKPLEEIHMPFDKEVFGGAIDHSKLSPILRFMAKRDKEGILAEGDYRNWEEIRSWAASLAEKLGE